MNLPEQFKNNMRELLGDEVEAYVASLEEERSYGIRVNTLRSPVEKFSGLVGGIVALDGNIPWCKEGFYYKDGQPGRHPYYHAGLYYIQEPSAMFPGATIDCRPGDYVLDICAAPGGKSTQAACGLGGEGLLVSNDISEERTKALVKNIEMAGVRNALITNETPENLARNFPEFFDKIIVDAPCSGEGMFRKDEQAVKSWESFKSDKCREMQDGILEQVDKMLKKGGLLVYSTCTFAPLENEKTIEAFINIHPEYKVQEIYRPSGIMPGRPEFCENPENGYGLEKAARLFPHKIRGEGHFTVLLKKGEADVLENTPLVRYNENGEEYVPHNNKKEKRKKREEIYLKRSYKLLNDVPDSLKAFFKKNMNCEPWKGSYFLMGTNLYYLPVVPPNIDRLKVARAGVFMGSVEYADFKPSHPFAMASGQGDFRLEVRLSPEGNDINNYLKGETMIANDSWRIFEGGNEIPFEEFSSATGADAKRFSGLCAVLAGDFVVGMGQLNGMSMKNMYPKGWRRFT